MKAKEYFDKYSKQIVEEAKRDESATIGKMYMDFVSEMKSMIESRHVKTYNGVIGIIGELNQKWNSIVNMFQAEYILSPVNRNGFAKAIGVQIPEVKERLVV